MADSEVFIYDKVTANPDIAEIRNTIKISKENHVNSVIDFGGSTIDAAQATAESIVSDIDVEE